MSAATHSLEAGSNFLPHKKARQARSGHRRHMPAATRALEAGSNFPAKKKKPPHQSRRPLHKFQNPTPSYHQAQPPK
ncbi:MAG: hypothetical protein FWF77_10255 [Defluviitaleaceae bacterium]|nr:hypothetical protein [Defluviitaleaceae bacterium]